MDPERALAWLTLTIWIFVFIAGPAAIAYAISKVKEAAATSGDACSGIYCGGPILESPFGIMLIMAAIIAILAFAIDLVRITRTLRRPRW